jgi:Asparagine synthase
MLYKIKESLDKIAVPYYFLSGRRPWSPGYYSVKKQSICQAIDCKLGKNGSPLPEKFGIGIDERVVEYPWIYSQLPNRPVKMLDAGSSLNHAFLIDRLPLDHMQLTIMTLAPEKRSFWSRSVSYVYGDLRRPEFAEKSSGLLKWHRNRSGFQSLIRSGVVLPDEPRHTVVSAPDRGRVDRRLREDHAFHILPGLLHYGDAISMAHSIETRHPFLDYRLVEWIFRAPMDVKLRDGETKWVLREYLRARGQREIGNRRDKKGYPTPAGAWLASEEGRYLESAVMRSGNLLHEWCEPARLANIFERQRRGAIAAEHHLYKIISTQMWIDRCILSDG